MTLRQHALTMPTNPAVLLLSVALAALMMGGCSQLGSGEDTESSSAASSEPVAIELPEHTMSLEQIRGLSMSTGDKSEMATGFPIPLPVVDGEVIQARPLPVEGGGEWAYTIKVAEQPATVTEWYSRAYPIANWQIVAAYEYTDEGIDFTVLEMTKGGAYSRISISPTDDETLVEAQISIGSGEATTL